MLPAASAFSAWARREISARAANATAAETLATVPIDRARIEGLIAAQGGDCGQALRKARAILMLATMERDLAGQAELTEVTGAMSGLADLAIAAALADATATLGARSGEPCGEESGLPQRLHVVGMGKLGGGELNVSSDIDLVFLYPEDGATRGGTVEMSNRDYFEALAKRLINLLDEVTPEGRVFRVDMRLRPWGDGPLAMSFAAFEDYLVAQGRDWERYAWLKARVVSGDRADELMRIVTPFVYRRYLDFGAIESLRGLHAQIKREVARRELSDHVKLGPGGIREIEFIAQALQMIRGGRDAGLRVRPTVAALRALAERGLLPAAAADELATGYDFLRRVEHRLQYADDQQTHTLPRSAESRLFLAKAMGCADWDQFQAALDEVRARVTRHFDAILGEEAPTTGSTRADGAARAQSVPELLDAGGFLEPRELARLIEATTDGARLRRLADATRVRFDALLPRLIETARLSAAPDLALKRTLAFLEAIASRSSYLALLAQSGGALTRLTRLAAASEWAAGYLTRHPILLDELIDARSLMAPPDGRAYSQFAAAAMERLRDDPEAQMNALREAHHAALFRLLAQDIEGLWSVEQLADHLTELADRTLAIALDECWRKVRERHREDPRFAIIAYGKLGGKELGYASDLDIIFIHDDADDNAALAYARLAQRLTTFLETQTTAGRLFEIDTRLRPDGAAGVLVTSLAAFCEYQEKRAWTWEHQALTRARFCAGDAAIGAAFEEERRRILCLPREPDKFRAEVRDMRNRMHAGHVNKTALFDLKHDAGGMVDIEFCVQTLVLLNAGAHPRLLGNLGNIALLGIAADCGLLSRELARACADAYRAYRKRQHALRMNNAAAARVDAAEFAAEIAAVKGLCGAVLALER
ncbi:MAG: bifunctional [glutamate--ammonia ligase]-adenylyl-L-tyrosine phosphorylase/[glutamate--ammonia-ligase] adenylyltransferase [Burkholderiales bacterium]|nr:bifunctional [glutamate--ammonia ligase]-adenylyl-L-tyrosine phosphorylase/[glutamate--ammonia-ligase] adenylyltransferase [Burkholderiales bacterium]